MFTLSASQEKLGPTKLGGLVGSKLNVTEAAKLVREELARTFPGQKFCVSVERYSMGESINVSWIDGAASIAVDRVLDKYQDIDYDPFAQEILSGGNRYVQGQRRYTRATREGAQTAFAQDPRGFPTAWNKLGSTAYPQVPFKCVRGFARLTGPGELD